MTTTTKPKRARILRPIRFSKKTVIFFFRTPLCLYFYLPVVIFCQNVADELSPLSGRGKQRRAKATLSEKREKRGLEERVGKREKKSGGERSSGIFFVCAFLFFVFLARRLRPSLPHCLIFHSSSLRLWQPFPCTGGIWVLPSFCFPNCCVNAPKILAFLPLSPLAPQSVNILSL